MTYNFMFFINAVLFGVGLAMDAFSVSLANGLNEPYMKKNKMCIIAGTFAAFQIGMPLAGFVCVHTVVKAFSGFEKFIPWIALLLLLYIGGKMLIEGMRGSDDDEKDTVGAGSLLVQGIATSIDALSVGFTIADYDIVMAFVEALIIGAVTFVICIMGLMLGKKAGTKLSGKAEILGGIILIFIGAEIFVTGVII